MSLKRVFVVPKEGQPSIVLTDGEWHRLARGDAVWVDGPSCVVTRNHTSAKVCLETDAPVRVTLDGVTVFECE